MGIEKHPVFEDINTLLKSLGYFLLNPVFKNDTEGYLHEFKTYPINISGNSIKIKKANTKPGNK